MEENLENLSNSDLCAIKYLLDDYLENLDKQLTDLGEDKKTNEGPSPKSNR